MLRAGDTVVVRGAIGGEGDPYDGFALLRVHAVEGQDLRALGGTGRYAYVEPDRIRVPTAVPDDPANGGTREVPVLLGVTDEPVLPAVPIRVEALRADTLAVVRSTIVAPRVDADFVLGPLPAGRYSVRAGSDLDGDGVICEEGDYCGMYPVQNDPQVLRIGAGRAVSGRRPPTHRSRW